jgi:tetratricopeptide (TPR) repeat protein
VLVAEDDMDEAERHYSRAVELCPDHPDHVFDYATFLAASGRHDDAESYFSEGRAMGHETATAYDSYEAFVDAHPWDTQFASKDDPVSFESIERTRRTAKDGTTRRPHDCPASNSVLNSISPACGARSAVS